MAGTKDKHGEYIGVREAHYAIVNEDSVENYTAGAPEYLAPSMSIAQEPSSNTKTRYYDNSPRYTTSTEGETKVNVVISGMTDDLLFKLLGKVYNVEDKRSYDTGSLANAPWVALSFIADVEGGFKAVQYLKGKFAPPNEEAETKSTDIAEKTTTLVFTAVKTIHQFELDEDIIDGVKRVVADSRLDDTLKESIWFSKVQAPPNVIQGTQATQTTQTTPEEE